jgi:hypothetical protein
LGCPTSPQFSTPINLLSFIQRDLFKTFYFYCQGTHEWEKGQRAKTNRKNEERLSTFGKLE